VIAIVAARIAARINFLKFTHLLCGQFAPRSESESQARRIAKRAVAAKPGGTVVPTRWRWQLLHKPRRRSDPPFLCPAC
jgi:hypothetical protein